jgi:pimeloyl-ACP methyl ester carboxylesterase
LKRIVLGLAALAATIVAGAYYSVPEVFKEPLVGLNRGLSGLSEKTVRVGVHEVHYLEGGSGETVVLLHGIFGEKDHWVDFARSLTSRYRVIVPDLPGYGESGRRADQAYDYAAQTERTRDLLDALGIQQAHLAGSSMGGTIAALVALKFPDRAISLAFIGAPHGIKTPRRSDMDRMIDVGEAPLIARNEAEFDRMLSLLFVKQPFLPYPVLHAAKTGAIQDAESNRRLWNEQLKNRHLLHERIDELRVRTLVTWGDADRIFDVSGAHVLRTTLKRSQVQVMSGVGHLPMMESPKEAASMYADFLAANRR